MLFSPLSGFQEILLLFTGGEKEITQIAEREKIVCAYELAKSALNSGRKGKKCEILSAGESERCEESRLVIKGMEWGPRAKKGKFTKGIECLFIGEGKMNYYASDKNAK